MVRVPVLVVIVAIAFAAPTYADDRPNDPFGTHTIELNEGPLVAIWKYLRDQVLYDKLRIQFCVEFSNEPCAPVSKLMKVVEEARENEGKALLGHLNRSINLMVKHVPRNWTGALETMKLGNGDCKAYSIAKYVAALEAGISPNHVRGVIVHNARRHEDHMVTAVYEDDQWLILDNLTMLLLPDSEKRDYEPLAVLDHTGVRRYAVFWFE
jgi:predicted transglutaminase-like cysteine proteinase